MFCFGACEKTDNEEEKKSSKIILVEILLCLSVCLSSMFWLERNENFYINHNL